jgi:GNAT superfamily N-acetyltransferase
MTAPRLLIRRAQPADTPAAQALFTVRSHSDTATDEDARCPDLSSPSRLMWLAFDGNRAIGMTGVQLRHLRVRGQEYPAAYWTGLFVDPSYRGQFVYPQLVLAMFAGLRERGIRHIYAAIRRQPVAEGHMKMGFRRIGDMAVLAKPLRPAMLLARYRRLLVGDTGRPWLRLACRAADTIASGCIHLQGPFPLLAATPVPWASSAVHEVAELARRAAGDHAAQEWTEERLRARYATAGTDYRLLVVRDGGKPTAAAIVRIVDRPEGIRAAVIMDFLFVPGAGRSARSVLAAVERAALAAGCDIALFLDGVASAESRIVRGRGFIRSPEKYVLLLWYDRGTDPALFPCDMASWRFAFGDHDTF